MNDKESFLKQNFLQLLKRIEPGISSNPGLASEFASRLADFTDVWAKDDSEMHPESNAGRLQRELEMWIKAR